MVFNSDINGTSFHAAIPAFKDSPRSKPLPGSLKPAKYPEALDVVPEDAEHIVQTWIDTFNGQLRSPHFADFEDLLFEESYWRDQLCLSWDFRTLRGPRQMVAVLESKDNKPNLRAFELDTDANGARVQRTSVDHQGLVQGIEAFLTVQCDVGIGRGVLRLLLDAQTNTWKAFTISTALYQLHDQPELVGHNRPSGLEDEVPGQFRNWQEKRIAVENFECGANPTVIVVGAGHNGLATAVRLKNLGISALVIDKNQRVGDGWRVRYDRLVLHDPVWYNHLPGLDFPPAWPVFTPKDKLANWLQLYADAHELNIWTSTSIRSVKWNGDSWKVDLTRVLGDGRIQQRRLTTCHIIQATGQAGEVHVPRIPGISTFEGQQICHSSEFCGGVPDSHGKRAVVVGSCNSAHDIAQDYHECGYDVTMVQRSATCVDPTRYTTGKGLYAEDGPCIEDADLLSQTLPNAVLKKKQIEVTKQLNKDHAELFTKLRKAGFALSDGPDGSGRKMAYFERGGGYYIDVGCSKLIAEGKIKVKQGSGVARITPNHVVLADGAELPADEVVFATGFTSMRDTSRKIFGDKVADQLKDIWGLDEEGELKSVWRRSGHPGFWVVGGNLALGRYFSRLLALQIKAVEMDLMPRGA